MGAPDLVDESSPISVAAYLRMSTDKQQYSILNQSLAIASYAEHHNMAIVRTYRDDGRSGLNIEHRPGLLGLMEDIKRGRPGYEVILVLDVSRWGRFQNVDEAAFYEFLCWRAGVRVCYVAELFENDGSPFAMIMKGLKRAMAAEYSRELSGKTSAGQRHLASLGFRQGAQPGYGLRRQLLNARGELKTVMASGEVKSSTTDRIVLIPGPKEEVRIVQWIFEQCLAGELCGDIARALNDRGWLRPGQRAWTYGRVRFILQSEKYAGDAVYGRSSKKLGGTLQPNPRGEWIRKPGAYRPVVSPETFVRAQAQLAITLKGVSDEELLEGTRVLYAREGRLTGPLIDAEPGLLASQNMARRFGGLTNLYRMVGFTPKRNPRYAAVRSWVTRWRQSLTAFTQDWLIEQGSVVRRDGWCLTIDGAWSLSFSVLNGCHIHSRRQPQWFNHRPSELTDIVVFARGVCGEVGLRDYLVLPRMLFADWPRGFYRANGPIVDSCAYLSLAVLGDLARLSRMETQACG
ncbi:recombinase family protein [Luteibacter sp. 9135]|uniref:recombinase family protein n=1 Tax=Luteibacter sp. 9135 TaxID=1500893 RepID=UPI00068F01DA|nr:recombinase family protein [Luteibacter sp. 9135]